MRDMSKKNKELSDEQLRRIANLASEKMMAEIPSEEELSKMYTFSEDFEKKMEALINNVPEKRRKHKPKERSSRVSWKRIAIVAIIIAILISSALSVQGVRNAVYEFIVNIYERFTIVSHEPIDNSGNSDDSPENSGDSPDITAPETIEKLMCPTYLPPGYTQSDAQEMGIMYMVFFVNDQGLEISFEQKVIDTTNNLIDTEDADYENVQVNGFNGFLSNKDNESELIWGDNQYTYHIRGTIEKEQILEMAESVK